MKIISEMSLLMCDTPHFFVLGELCSDFVDAFRLVVLSRMTWYKIEYILIRF